MASTKYMYRVAPVSRDVFTIAEVVNNASYPFRIELVSDKFQNVNLATLNESGLHRALYILKNRMDPNELGTARESWERLPESKQIAYDVELHKAFPENMLRVLLQNFMETWATETIAGKLVSRTKTGANQIDLNKFKTIPGWPALHSVKPPSVSESQLVMTQRGMQIQPEQCVAKLGELRKKINELADSLASCSDIACYEAATESVGKFRQTEAQSKCITPFPTPF